MLTHAIGQHRRTHRGTRTSRNVGRRKYTQTEMLFITDGCYETSRIDVSCIIRRRKSVSCCEFQTYFQVVLITVFLQLLQLLLLLLLHYYYHYHHHHHHYYYYSITTNNTNTATTTTTNNNNNKRKDRGVQFSDHP